MRDLGRWLWLGMGLGLGVAGTLFHHASSQPALAHNDRHEDYIIATGPIMKGPVINNILATETPPGKGPNPPLRLPVTTTMYDGVWMLDYRAGKLLGAIVDSVRGKMSAWEDVDLMKEFSLAPKQNVHFLMTTGTTINGQTALYLAETVSGRFAIYTMSLPTDPRQPVVIRRHDTSKFRTE
jgi:hypothetical protein